MSRRALGLDGRRTGMRQRTAMVVQMTAQKMNSVSVIVHLRAAGCGGCADDGVGTADDGAHAIDESALVHLDAVLDLDPVEFEVHLREAAEEESSEWRLCHGRVSM